MIHAATEPLLILEMLILEMLILEMLILKMLILETILPDSHQRRCLIGRFKTIPPESSTCCFFVRLRRGDAKGCCIS